jgi:uncharacterized coiled-coil protein SlyX
LGNATIVTQFPVIHHRQFMNFREVATTTSAALFLCIALCLPSRGEGAGDDELAELKRTIRELQVEIRELTKRLKALEAENADHTLAPRQKPEQKGEKADSQSETAESSERLAQRVKELEIAKAAQEQATRLIIQNSLAKMGSKINEAVTFGGAMEMLAGRSNDYLSPTKKTLKFNTAELDFEIQVNPWTLGTFVVQYVDGTGTLFPTNTGFVTGVDRINLDRAYFTIGDTQKFPLYVRGGRMSLPFGTSTGVHRADVLSIDSPLTIEAFEIRKTAIGLGFGLPTPTPIRTAPPVFAPRVNPLVVNPIISSLAEGLDYKPPPTRPKPPTPIVLAPNLPPLYGSLYFYDSNDTGAVNRSFTRNVSGRLGYRAGGHCGRPYHELSRTGPCPWSLDVNLDYNSSIFDSRFLEFEYRRFMNRFGPVPGRAANVRLTIGAVSLVGEVNGATKRAVFRDDLGNNVGIKPAAWQLSLGYQLDWNPWVETIGAQGTFLAIGYSESRDLAGVTQVINGAPSRVGFVPKKRLTLTAGEWVLDGVKLLVEYSRIRDYSVIEGGTGASGKGIFTSLTYTW